MSFKASTLQMAALLKPYLTTPDPVKKETFVAMARDIWSNHKQKQHLFFFLHSLFCFLGVWIFACPESPFHELTYFQKDGVVVRIPEGKGSEEQWGDLPRHSLPEVEEELRNNLKSHVSFVKRLDENDPLEIAFEEAGAVKDKKGAKTRKKYVRSCNGTKTFSIKNQQLTNPMMKQVFDTKTTPRFSFHKLIQKKKLPGKNYRIFKCSVVKRNAGEKAKVKYECSASIPSTASRRCIVTLPFSLPRASPRTTRRWHASSKRSKA